MRFRFFVLITKPFDVLHASGLTPQRCAASATSISRAEAPIRRIWSQCLRTLRLPPVNCAPRSGSAYARFAGAISIRTFDQSASISSARICGSAVRTP